MEINWIKHVIDDLRDFAKLNELPTLAIALADAAECAEFEISMRSAADVGSIVHARPKGKC